MAEWWRVVMVGVVAGAAMAWPERVAADPPTIEELVLSLGHSSFAKRERATAALLERGAAALVALQRAGESSDAEVASRARRLAQRIREDERVAALPAVDRERVADERAYEADPLRWQSRRGTWVVIAHGKVMAEAATFDAVLAAAADTTRAALHRFVFQAGTEGAVSVPWHVSRSRPLAEGTIDGGVDFGLSTDQRGWVYQLRGSREWKPLAEIELSLDVGAPMRIPFRGANIEMSGGDVCVGPELADRMGLFRYERPGLLTREPSPFHVEHPASDDAADGFPARLARVRLRVDGIDQAVWRDALIRCASPARR